jgi:hypothetical protein
LSLRSFSSASSCSRLTSLRMYVFGGSSTLSLAPLSFFCPRLRSLLLEPRVHADMFGVWPCLHDLTCRLQRDTLTLPHFTTFVSRLPSLTALNMPAAFPEGWGAALASSCPHLTHLRLRFESPVYAPDLSALRLLSLTCLEITFNRDAPYSHGMFPSHMQAIGCIDTLQTVSLGRCYELREKDARALVASLHLLRSH